MGIVKKVFNILEKVLIGLISLLSLVVIINFIQLNILKRIY